MNDAARLHAAIDRLVWHCQVLDAEAVEQLTGLAAMLAKAVAVPARVETPSEPPVVVADAPIETRSARMVREDLGWRQLTEDEAAEQLRRNVADICPGDVPRARDTLPAGPMPEGEPDAS